MIFIAGAEADDTEDEGAEGEEYKAYLSEGKQCQYTEHKGQDAGPTRTAIGIANNHIGVDLSFYLFSSRLSSLALNVVALAGLAVVTAVSSVAAGFAVASVVAGSAFRITNAP